MQTSGVVLFWQVPSKKTEQLRLKVTPELKQSLQAMASKLERTPSWLAHTLIEEGIKRRAKGKGGK